MATRLQQIVSATAVPAGGTVHISHSINVDGTAKIPDRINRSNLGFTGVSASTTEVVVRNDTGAEADIKLYLRLYHTIDRVYGDKSTLALTPDPWWDDGSGSIVVPDAMVNTFVFQPGGISDGVETFADFADLYTAVVAARATAGGSGNVPIIIGVDTLLGAATIPAGTYSMENVTLVGVGAPTGQTPTVTFADGTVFNFLRRFENIIVVNANTTTPPITDVVDGDQFLLNRAVLSTTTGVNVPLIRMGVTGTWTLRLQNGSALGGGSLGGTQTGRVMGITGAANKHAVIVLDASSRIAVPTALVGGAGADLLIEAPSGTQIPIVAGWTSAATNPQLDVPAGLRPNPYLGAGFAGSVTMAHGDWARIDGAAGQTQALPSISAASVSARGAGVMSAVTNTTSGTVAVTLDAGDTLDGVNVGVTLDGKSTLVVISDGVSNWSTIAFTTAVPQVLKTLGYDAAAATQAIANNAAIAVLVGYAWQQLNTGTAIKLAWRNTTAAADLTWGEVAIGTGLFVAGDAGTSITPMGFADAAATMNANNTNNTATITLASTIRKGQGIWVIFAAANTTSAPEVAAGLVDVAATGAIATLATAGWRPSAQLGVAATFLTSGAVAAPKGLATA